MTYPVEDFDLVIQTPNLLKELLGYRPRVTLRRVRESSRSWLYKTENGWQPVPATLSLEKGDTVEIACEGRRLCFVVYYGFVVQTRHERNPA